MPHKEPAKRREYVNKYRAEIRKGLRKPGSVDSLKRGEDIKCHFCGMEFHRSPSGIRPGNQYCSRECMAKAFEGKFVGEKSPRWTERRTVICDNCGKVILRPRWEFVGQEHAFCHPQCFGEWKSKNWTGEDNPYWRGGHPPYYGKNWKVQSYRARKRDRYQCQVCGASKSEARRALDVHHIMPFRFFDSDEYEESNTLSNLITLCENCHHCAEAISRNGEITDWSRLYQLVVQRKQDVAVGNLKNAARQSQEVDLFALAGVEV